MEWSSIPDFDSASSSADENLFAGPKPPSTGKIFDRLNLNVVEGYSSKKSSDASGLQHDQFIKTARSQNKGCVGHTDKETLANKVTFWYNRFVLLNSSYSRIVRSSGLQTTSPAFPKKA